MEEKEINIDDEEQILNECDFDYFYNLEKCSRELCMFYNDIFKQKNNFNTRQAIIDLGRVGITLNQLSKRIKELEAKLAEKEKTIQAYEKIVEQKDEETRFANRDKIYIVKQLNDPKDYVLLEDYKKVEQQLAEKDKEISNLNGLVRERDKQIKNLKTNKKRVVEHKNKTKISFAVEQLEKVKENIKKVPITDFDLSGNFEKMYKQDAIRQIDNQIKSLKGENQ